MPTFTVTDTRKAGSAITVRRMDSVVRLRELIAVSRELDNEKVVGFRSDLDEKQQSLLLDAHKQRAFELRQREWKSASYMSPENVVVSLKMLITEAERYQRATGMNSLHKIGESRLEMLGSKKLMENYQTSDISEVLSTLSISEIISRDIDLVLSLPEDSFRGANMSCLDAANKAVKELPLWHNY